MKLFDGKFVVTSYKKPLNSVEKTNKYLFTESDVMYRKQTGIRNLSDAKSNKRVNEKKRNIICIVESKKIEISKLDPDGHANFSTEKLYCANLIFPLFRPFFFDFIKTFYEPRPNRFT